MCCLLLWLMPAASQPLAFPDDEALLLLEVQLEGQRLADVIPAYEHGEDVLLPLGMLAQLLGLAIEARPEQGLATGFVLHEGRRFQLDVGRGEATLAGVAAAYAPERVYPYPDDIYVDRALLQEWLPLRLSVDLLLAQLRVESTEPLPLQRRLQRERRNAMLRRGGAPARDYPPHVEPYLPWEVPFSDHSLRLRAAHGGSGADLGAAYVSYGAGDLAFMESSWYVTGNEERAVDQFRLTLGRTDPAAELLGPLQASAFRMGHVSGPAIGLVSRPGLPRPGVLVSNLPLRRQMQFDTHTFEGDLPPGWDVELYHNNSLIGYARGDANGRYRFDEVPLLFGNNHFRLVFYGPQGQQRQEDVRFTLGDSLIRPGEAHYRLFANDSADGIRASLEYDLGLTRWLSLSTAAVALPEEIVDEPRRYGVLGLRGFWQSVFLRLDTVVDDSDGRAAELGLQTGRNGVNLSAAHTWLHDFDSELFPSFGDPVIRRSALRLDAALPPTGYTSRKPIMLERVEDVRASGRRQTRYTNRIATVSRGVAASHRLSYRRYDGYDPLLDGVLQGSFRWRNYGLRGDLYYLLQPEQELAATSLTLDARYPGGYRASLTVNHSFDPGGDLYVLGLDRRTGPVGFRADFSYRSGGETALNLYANLSLGREPRAGRWHPAAHARAGGGAVSAIAFLDRSGSGVLDDEAEILEDVGFTVNGALRRSAGDDRQVGFLTGLPVHQPVDIGLATHTLVDPSWVPVREGVRTVLRPGHVTRLEFPVALTAELDGTVYLEQRGRSQPVGGVVLELIDAAGEVVSTAASAYDGFYLFERIPLGRYRLRVAPEQGARLGLEVPAAVVVEFDADQLLISDLNLVLQRP